MSAPFRRTLRSLAFVAGLAALAAFPFALAHLLITDFLDRVSRPESGVPIATCVGIALLPLLLELCVGLAIVLGVLKWRKARAEGLTLERFSRACRRTAWRLVAVLAGVACFATLLAVSRVAFPMMIGAIEGIAHGRFAAGIGTACALVLWTGTGLVAVTLVHMGAEAALAKAQALRVVPLAVINPQPKENR